MNHRAFARVLLTLPLVLGCKRAATQRVPGAASARPTARAARVPASASSLAGGAFDLVSTESGAALVFTAGASDQLTLSWYDAVGQLRRTEPLFANGGDAGPSDAGAAARSIAEVAAVARNGELAVAWIEERAGGAQSRALVRSITDSGSAPNVLDIGPVSQPLSRPRGNVAVTTTQDRFLVLARGEKTACVDKTEHDCVSYDFHRLEPHGTTRQSLPLAVPLPCDRNSVSFAVAGTRWYYGVCSRATGKPITTLFSIQTDPEYARADRLLEGCLPLGALAEAGDLLVIGDCDGERRGVRLRGGNAEASDLRVDRLDAVCDGGRPLLRQLGPAGIRLELDGPRDRLEGFLPRNLVPPNARAVWTGRALLVAAPTAAGITLKGYQCDSTLLREIPLAPR